MTTKAQTEPRKRIAYDIKLMRPGCVLLQAAFRCDPHVADKFPVDSWLVFPTDDLKVYEVSDRELEYLVTKSDCMRLP